MFCYSYEVLQYPLADFLAEDEEAEEAAEKDDMKDEADDILEAEIESSNRGKYFI